MSERRERERKRESDREGTKKQAEHSLNCIPYFKIDSDKHNWKKKFTDTKKMHQGLIDKLKSAEFF